MISVTKPQKDYELLDSGEGEKLERYGAFTLSRPDPQALWHKKSPELWSTADASFRESGWTFNKDLPEKWLIELGGLSFWIKPSTFKHTGVFPEQVSNWSWIEETLRASGKKAKVLNLFGYTGGATLSALKGGAEVTHCDASKVALSAVRENAEASGFGADAVRLILDDAFKFVKREAKRGARYDGIIMDPPAFGRGPKGEVWKIENDFLPFLSECKKILSGTPLFVLINGYAAGYSPIAYEENLKEMVGDLGGALESGELAIEESKTGRLLPAGIFARWQA